MSEPSPVVRVVDDDQAFRTAITRLLRAGGYQVRAYSSAGDFLLTEDDDGPGCILLDLRMPGPDGLDLQAAISRRRSPIPVIFLTAHADVGASVLAMKSGAEDFLTKPTKRERLFAVIEVALARDQRLRAARFERDEIRRRFEALSPRERAVLEHVVAGRLNKQIASAIGTSERTVKAHRARVMSKMGAASVADLVRSAGRLRERDSQARAI